MIGIRKTILAASMALALTAGVFFAGRWSAASGGPRRTVAEAPEMGTSPAWSGSLQHLFASRAARPPLSVVPPAPVDRDVVRPEAEAEASQARAQRAAFLFDKVFGMMKVQANIDPSVVPEARAEGVRAYLTGLVVGAIQADPEMRPAFSARFTSTLCGAEAPEPEQVISLAHVGLALPDLPTAEGFDCFFSRQKKEEVPLWFMLDAWQESGLGKPPALARLEVVATDSRTTRRLLNRDEAAAQRIRADDHPEGERTR